MFGSRDTVICNTFQYGINYCLSVVLCICIVPEIKLSVIGPARTPVKTAVPWLWEGDDNYNQSGGFTPFLRVVNVIIMRIRISEYWKAARNK